MIKKLLINGQELDVEIISKSGKDITFRLSGQLHTFSLKKNDHGKILVADSSGISSTVYSAQDNLYDCIYGQFKIQAVKKTSIESQSENEKTLTSPLPGKVIKVCVALGDKVREGDEIVRIEAMKMEHRICAQMNGTLKSIKVKEGDTVSDGEHLGEIDL